MPSQVSQLRDSSWATGMSAARWTPAAGRGLALLAGSVLPSPPSSWQLGGAGISAGVHLHPLWNKWISSIFIS